MGSTRLPGKALLPLAGKSMTENIIDRVRRAKRLDDVVLAVPPKDENAFASMPCRIHAPLVDENDLVGRYLVTAERCHADIIVRVPCDNPCIEPEYIDKAVEDYLDLPYVFYSNTTDLVNHTWIDGVGAEVLSMSRLKWLDGMTKGDQRLREHPHKFFWERYKDNEAPECGIIFGKELPDHRLDVNDQEDYEAMQNIYSYFGNNQFHVSQWLDIVTSK